MLIALALVWTIGTAAGLWWLDRRAERRAKAVIRAVEIARQELSLHIAPLFPLLDAVRTLEGTVRRQGASLALFPEAMTGLTTKIEGIFQRYEEHALAPDAEASAPLVMSRIERHRRELEEASEASFVALQESLKAGGREPALRVRGNE